jgi:serine/threonine protein kinase
MTTDPSNAPDAGGGSSDQPKEQAPEDSAKIRFHTPARVKAAAPVDVDLDDTGIAMLDGLTIGAIVDGKYRVDEFLGRGAMGVVVAATHTALGERVALKFLRFQHKLVGKKEDFKARFKREARATRRRRSHA